MLVSVGAEFQRDRVLLVRENPVQWMYEKSRARVGKVGKLEKERKGREEEFRPPEEDRTRRRGGKKF